MGVGCWSTPNLRTKIPDFGGFDSSRVLIIRGGSLTSIGNFPEMSSQAISVGIILVGRSGVSTRLAGAHNEERGKSRRCLCITVVLGCLL